MGFFAKLFRRKKDNVGSVGTESNSSKTSRNSRKTRRGGGQQRSRGGVVREPTAATATTKGNETQEQRDSPTEQMQEDNAPTCNSSCPPRVMSTMELAERAEVAKTALSRGIDASEGSQKMSIPRNNINSGVADQVIPAAASGESAKSDPVASSLARTSPKNNSSRKGTGPVDLDQSDLDTGTISSSAPDEDEHRHNSPRLSTQRLQQFTQQQQQQPKTSQPLLVYNMALEQNPPRQHKLSTNNTRFSAGQIALGMDDSRSDAESSSFNLSTDAEDIEYEAMRRGYHMSQPSALSTTPNYLNSSSLLTTTTGPSSANNVSQDHSQVSSPNYNTDGETSIFPNLQTDDEGTATEKESQPAATNRLAPSRYHGQDDQQPGRITSTLNDKPTASIHTGQGEHPQNWRSSASLTNDQHDSTWTPRDGNNFDVYGTRNGLNENIALTKHSSGTRRDFTSPKNSRDSHVDDAFENFADFSNVFPSHDNTWKQDHSSSSYSKNRSYAKEVDDRGHPERSLSLRQMTSSSPAVHTDTNLSDLLAQAKSKSTQGRRSEGGGGGGGGGGNSVSSAPAISSVRHRHSHSQGKARSEVRADNVSVTDIIESLEAASSTRGHARRNSFRDGDAHSNHSRDGTSASVRSAKERLRRRREREIRRASRGPEDDDSSESEENQAAETWLFDEVTGALGPRGITADLESLSGRSNRSRSSGGGRSHKSHRSHRSHKSHRSSSNNKRSSHRKTSSGESVDSHGSRRSRGSRYSHRSTRSYISQMSEQSRSVANDLLRLEMQLAMVGNSNTGDGVTPAPNSSGNGNREIVVFNGRESSSGSRSMRSSSGRHGSSGGGSSRRSSSARRSRISVVAPPGKLGIILANKADSKGTVVSGVRTSSVLAERISPGDRIVAIDGEDVSLMTVSEITTIMARKSDFERTLTILTTPKHQMADDYGGYGQRN